MCYGMINVFTLGPNPLKIKTFSEEVEQRLQTFKDSGSLRDQRLRLLELIHASIPNLLNAEIKALDD